MSAEHSLPSELEVRLACIEAWRLLTPAELAALRDATHADVQFVIEEILDIGSPFSRLRSIPFARWSERDGPTLPR